QAPLPRPGPWRRRWAGYQRDNGVERSRMPPSKAAPRTAADDCLGQRGLSMTSDRLSQHQESQVVDDLQDLRCASTLAADRLRSPNRRLRPLRVRIIVVII